MEYIVMVRNGGQVVEFTVGGTEAAYAAYQQAKALCELVEGSCDLLADTDGNGLLVALESYGYDFNFDEDEEDFDEDYEDYDPYLECGFDPYVGGYTYDC